MNEKRIRKRNRKNINNLSQILERNYSRISRIIVSEDFMKVLKKESDLVNINSEKISDSKTHDFKEIHASYTEENEMWMLWNIPVMFSNVLKSGAILELKDKNSIIIEGISEYKNK